MTGAAHNGHLQQPTQGMSLPSLPGRPSLPMSSLGGGVKYMQPPLTSAHGSGTSAAVQASPAQASGVQDPLQGQHPEPAARRARPGQDSSTGAP